MTKIIRAEFRKLFSTQVWFWLLSAAVAVTALVVIARLASSGGVTSYADAVDTLNSGVTAYIVVFVLGILGVTTEYRYQTITPTVLATPSRWTLVGAKMLTYAIVGALYAVACMIVELAIALPWLSAKGYHLALTSHHVPRALLGLFLVVALFGTIGMGIGALLRNQIVAVSVGVIFVLILNNLISAIPKVRVIFPYTPNGAVQSILNHGTRHFDGYTLFAFGGGVVVLVFWAIIPAIVGARLTMTRDIT